MDVEKWREDGKYADKCRKQRRSHTKRNLLWDRAFWIKLHKVVGKLFFFFFWGARAVEVRGALLTPVQSPHFITKKTAPFGAIPQLMSPWKEMLWRRWGQRGIQASQSSVVNQQPHKDMTLSLWGVSFTMHCTFVIMWEAWRGARHQNHEVWCMVCVFL